MFVLHLIIMENEPFFKIGLVYCKIRIFISFFTKYFAFIKQIQHPIVSFCNRTSPSKTAPYFAPISKNQTKKTL